jgi:proline iminopeptidase
VDGAGFNFYANRLTQQDLESHSDPRPALRRGSTPTLVMKGECDYVPWLVARDYVSSFPNSRMVFLERTGHLLWGGQPDLTFQVMRAFLADDPLPIAEILL